MSRDIVVEEQLGRSLIAATIAVRTADPKAPRTFHPSVTNRAILGQRTAISELY